MWMAFYRKASNAIGDGVLEAHLPHFSARLAFVSVKEQAAVVEGPETASWVRGRVDVV